MLFPGYYSYSYCPPHLLSIHDEHATLKHSLNINYTYIVHCMYKLAITETSNNDLNTYTQTAKYTNTQRICFLKELYQTGCGAGGNRGLQRKMNSTRLAVGLVATKVCREK